MSEILFEKSISFRNPPKNLITNDTYLFNHELKREIKSSYIFFEKNVYTFNKENTLKELPASANEPIHFELGNKENER